MSKFKIGGTVKVVDVGYLYSTHSDWAASYKLSNYRSGRNFGNNLTGKVVATGKHNDSRSAAMLYGITIDGQDFIIGERGLELVQEKLPENKKITFKNMLGDICQVVLKDGRYSGINLGSKHRFSMTEDDFTGYVQNKSYTIVKAKPKPQRIQFRHKDHPCFTHSMKKLEDGSYKITWARGWAEETGETIVWNDATSNFVEEAIKDGNWIIVGDVPFVPSKPVKSAALIELEEKLAQEEDLLEKQKKLVDYYKNEVAKAGGTVTFKIEGLI